jgi:hypothetical protein
LPKRIKPHRRYSRFKHRAGKAKAPLETLVAGALIPFTPAQTGQLSPWDYLQKGDINGVVVQLKSGFLGMDYQGNIDIAAAINPMNMEKARYVKMLIFGTLLGVVRRKITGKYTTPLMKKIPILGRMVS